MAHMLVYNERFEFYLEMVHRRLQAHRNKLECHKNVIQLNNCFFFLKKWSFCTRIITKSDTFQAFIIGDLVITAKENPKLGFSENENVTNCQQKKKKKISVQKMRLLKHISLYWTTNALRAVTYPASFRMNYCISAAQHGENQPVVLLKRSERPCCFNFDPQLVHITLPCPVFLLTIPHWPNPTEVASGNLLQVRWLLLLFTFTNFRRHCRVCRLMYSGNIWQTRVACAG